MHRVGARGADPTLRCSARPARGRKKGAGARDACYNAPPIAWLTPRRHGGRGTRPVLKPSSAQHRGRLGRQQAGTESNPQPGPLASTSCAWTLPFDSLVEGTAPGSGKSLSPPEKGVGGGVPSLIAAEAGRDRSQPPFSAFGADGRGHHMKKKKKKLAEHFRELPGFATSEVPEPDCRSCSPCRRRL